VTNATGGTLAGRRIAFSRCVSTVDPSDRELSGPFELASGVTDSRGLYLIRAERRTFPSANFFRYRCFVTVAPDTSVVRDSLLMQFAPDSVGGPLQTLNLIVR
jgi:hypothetical protein